MLYKTFKTIVKAVQYKTWTFNVTYICNEYFFERVQWLCMEQNINVLDPRSVKYNEMSDMICNKIDEQDLKKQS